MEKAKKASGLAVYRIEVLEGLAAEDGARFPGFTMSRTAGGGTLLSGVIADQAAVHGLIRKLRDLGLTLVSLQRSELRE